VHFLAKEELFTVPLLGVAIRSLNSIPIRRGAADLSGLARAIAALKAGGGLLLFPEGSRMRDGELHSPRPGVGLMAVQGDVPIVPCYISGSNRSRGWLTRSARARLWFGPVRGWRELAGPEADSPPGRLLYQRVGEGVMREIAALKSDQERSASRGAA
jgi:1-acyl-sn-glycerol-3-phosphate acyltransferase